MAGAHTGRNAADTDPYLPFTTTNLRKTYSYTNAARTSEPCTNRLTPGPARLERIYPRVYTMINVRRSRIAERENHVTGEMLSLRANCRFQVRAVVDLSLPALGE